VSPHYSLHESAGQLRVRQLLSNAQAVNLQNKANWRPARTRKNEPIRVLEKTNPLRRSKKRTHSGCHPLIPNEPNRVGTLLGFAVRLVLPAVGAELLHFETFCCGFFVLGVRVVPVFALGALERDDFSWHLSSLYAQNGHP